MDPLDDFDRRDARQAVEESHRLSCDSCDYPIWDSHYYEIFGKIICPDCIRDALKFSEDYT